MIPGTASERIEKYQFDNFELFPKQHVLKRAGLRIPLTPTPLRVLLLLVESAGETVSKEDLFARVWNGAPVEENNLAKAVLTLRKALGETRGENRYIVTDPGRGYRFVAPVSRVMEAGVTSNGIQSPEPATEEPTHLSGLSRRVKLLTLIAVPVLLVLVLAVGFWMYRATIQPPARQSIAVLPVRNLSNASTESWLQTALSEMLTSELAAGGKLRTIPAEDVVRWRADLGSAGDSESQAALLHSAQNYLGADTFVVGSYVVTGTCPQCRVRVDLGVLRARTGERLGTVIDEGPAADLLDLTTRLGRRLRAELGLRADAPTPQRWPAASAMREYSEGLATLRRGDPLAAREHLEIAVAADSGNPLIHSALAETWTALGYGTRAQDEDKRAYDLAGSLDRLDRLGVEARYRASAKDWNRAIEIYKSIYKLFPDSLNDGLNLARAQWRAQRIPDATTTLNELRRLPKPAGDDPRIDLLEAQAAGSLNNFARTRTLAHRAAEEAKNRGARYLFARARLLEGGAMLSINEPGAVAVLDDARQTCEAIGDRGCVSQAWRIRGNERYVSGDFQAAQLAYASGVAIAREAGNQSELANLLVGIAVVEEANRDWGPAEQNLQEAIALKIETGFNPNEVRNQLADLYISLGRLNDAGKLLQNVAATMGQLGAHEDVGTMLFLQAKLDRAAGQLDRAIEHGARAVAETRQSGDELSLRLALAEMSSIHTAVGQITQADKDLADAGAGKWPQDQGAVELARAESSLAHGEFQSAAQQAGKSAAAFDKGRQDEQAARAFVTAADALEMAHRNGDALAACGEAEKRAKLTPNPYVGTLSQICSWQMSSATRMPPALESAVTSLNSPEITLWLDYARARKVGHTDRTRSRAMFEKLAADAGRLGYVTLQRRAGSLAAN